METTPSRRYMNMLMNFTIHFVIYIRMKVQTTVRDKLIKLEI